MIIIIYRLTFQLIWKINFRQITNAIFTLQDFHDAEEQGDGGQFAQVRCGSTSYCLGGTLQGRTVRETDASRWWVLFCALQNETRSVTDCSHILILCLIRNLKFIHNWQMRPNPKINNRIFYLFIYLFYFILFSQGQRRRYETVQVCETDQRDYVLQRTSQGVILS